MPPPGRPGRCAGRRLPDGEPRHDPGVPAHRLSEHRRRPRQSARAHRGGPRPRARARPARRVSAVRSPDDGALPVLVVAQAVVRRPCTGHDADAGPLRGMTGRPALLRRADGVALLLVTACVAACLLLLAIGWARGRDGYLGLASFMPVSDALGYYRCAVSIGGLRSLAAPGLGADWCS